MARDTIFALSSGQGAAGVAIIRLSGPLAFDSATKLCGALPAPRQAGLRAIRDCAGEVIDRGVVLAFPGPNSFTGEDIVEFQVHGSIAVIRDLLDTLGQMPGMRAAEAGEFTQRAFENSRMDLLQVEALGDLLAAETRAQARLAQQQAALFHRAAEDWRGRLLQAMAMTEALIDFSDEGDVTDRFDSDVKRDLSLLAEEMAAAAGRTASAERIRRGFRVAVLGPPNAGKSSLVNALAAREVAITSPQPGTTRDVIEVHLDLGGFPVVLMDTAGIRESGDEIERIGIDRARDAGESADLVLWLAPSSVDESDAPEHAMVIRSRCDEIDSEASRTRHCISTRTGEGLAALIASIRGRAESTLGTGAEGIIAAHARQRSALMAAGDHLACAISLEAFELRAEELRLAARALDRLFGRIDQESILGEIFSRFCIGK